MNRLVGKVAFVTGAGQGIGESIARAFCQEGAIVVLAELDLAKAESVAASINQGGTGKALAIQTDVTSPDSIGAAVEQAKERFKAIHVLVNNAGINVFRDPLGMSQEDWDRCFSVDLDGVWYGCRAVLPLMLAGGGGSIINIASIHSFRIIRGCFPYPVAKHALLGLTRALALEFGGEGIRVNAIAPGYIETRLSKEYWNAQPDPAAARARTYALNPTGRIGRPEEVAMTAVFLASDEAPFINAGCITIDGGLAALYHE
jgi:NAD(P)-dependent dehydrogenase (short-subunit alcohol dehydrogenase family)